MKYSPGASRPGAAARPLHSAPPSCTACPGEHGGAVLRRTPEQPVAELTVPAAGSAPSTCSSTSPVAPGVPAGPVGIAPCPSGVRVTCSSGACSRCSQRTARSVLALSQGLLGHAGCQTGVSNIICSLTCGNGGQMALRNLRHSPCSLSRRAGRC